MIVRNTFLNVIGNSVAGAKHKTIDCPANSAGEQHLATVARAMADHIEFTNAPGHSESEINHAKSKLGAVIEQYPDAFETLSTIGDKVIPESVTVGFQQALPGVFVLDVHEFGLFNSPPTICGERTGTLFVDTTPGQDGIETFFVPLSRDGQAL